MDPEWMPHLRQSSENSEAFLNIQRPVSRLVHTGHIRFLLLQYQITVDLVAACNTALACYSSVG